MLTMQKRNGDFHGRCQVGASGLTLRSSHFSSSVTHLVFPGASSMRYFSLDSPFQPAGYNSTLLRSVVSTKRAATAGASSATSEDVLNFILIRKYAGWYEMITAGNAVSDEWVVYCKARAL